MHLPDSAEREVALACLNSRQVQRSLSQVLRPEHFPTPAIGRVVGAAMKLWQEHHQAPTEGQMQSLLHGDGHALEMYAKVVRSKQPADSWATETGRFMAARHAVLSMDVQGCVDKGRFDVLRKQASLAERLVSPEGRTTIGVGSREEFLARHNGHHGGVPTGIPSLDAAMPGGGLQSWRTGCLLAKKGGGKTTTLVNLGFSARMHGLPVTHYTLEDDADEIRAKYDRRLLKMTREEITPEVFDAQAGALADFHEGLRIVDLAEVQPTLGSVLADAERQDNPPGLMIVDYLQCFSKGGSTDQHGRRLALIDTSQELVRWAKHHRVPTWTAFQVNRSGLDRVYGGRMLSMLDVAEAYDALWPMQAIVSINQTPGEVDAGVGHLYLDECRDGRAKVAVPVHIDFGKTLVTEINTL